MRGPELWNFARLFDTVVHESRWDSCSGGGGGGGSGAVCWCCCCCCCCRFTHRARSIIRRLLCGRWCIFRFLLWSRWNRYQIALFRRDLASHQPTRATTCVSQACCCNSTGRTLGDALVEQRLVEIQRLGRDVLEKVHGRLEHRQVVERLREVFGPLAEALNVLNVRVHVGRVGVQHRVNKVRQKVICRRHGAFAAEQD